MKKTIKRSICVMLAAVLTVLMVSVPAAPVSAAKKKVSLTRTRIALTAGSAAKLKIKGTGRKVKWSVKGKKLVTLRPRGRKQQTVRIKAGKKTGRCYVVASIGKRTWKCRVTVSAPAAEEKKISKSSVNVTKKYKAKKTKTLKADSTFVRAVSNSSVELLKETVAAEKKGTNVLISPDSVFTALSLVECGASGKTLSEMKKALGGISAGKYSRYLNTLHRRLSRDQATDYRVANSLWYKKGEAKMKKAYLKKIVSSHGAEVYASPFNSRTLRDINNWTYNHTEGKISDIIDRLEPSARTVAVNAVYFKGGWAEPYGGTRKRTFTAANGTAEKVAMLEGVEHTYVTAAGASGFVKYYRGGNTAFMALLPPKGTSADDFVAQLTGQDIMDAYRKRVDSGVRVYTRMPEFRYDYSASLVNPLKKMGILSAFTPAADFSKMSSSGICIDDILHKTYIDLNKDGTEAAAVTALIMKNSSIPMKMEEKKVYLNRPFVYAIIDTDTGIPLFIGTLNHVK